MALMSWMGLVHLAPAHNNQGENILKMCGLFLHQVTGKTKKIFRRERALKSARTAIHLP